MKRSTALATATALVAGTLALAAGITGASAASTNLLTNGGFETGTLSAWSCSTLDSVVTSPVHSGGYALQGAASSSDDAQCTQTVSVQPNTTYTLAGYVQGSYVYIGDTGTGTTDTNNWTPGTGGAWTQLSTTFTTGAATTSVQIYTHGWYGQGTYYADDLTLTGPGGPTSSPSASSTSSSPTASASPTSSSSPSSSPSASSSPTSSSSPSASSSPSPTATSTGGGTAPGGDGLVSTPTGITAKVTNTAITLSWSASTDSSGTGDTPAYHVFNGSNIVATSMGTSVTVSSLLPNTAYTFTVQGYDKDGHASAQSAPVSATTAAAATGAMKSAYFDQWSIYGNAYYPKNVDTSGAAGHMKTITYAFENIDPTNLTCFEAVKAADTNESDPNAGDGAGDAYADYQKSYTSDISVDGTSDTWSQPIKGNFNQLRELKAKNPNLRINLSIGGWTYSKYFSSAAATDASRKKFVSSCIDMFIKGNLPTGVAGDASGGPASGAGIFDGIDIDWEYPASSGGHTGNIYSPADTANYTALLGEFRSELDAYGASIGKHFMLTAALPSGQDKISLIQPAAISQYLDYGDLMTYDMHGAWDSTGPTNFQDPLHDSPNDPSNAITPGTAKYNIDETIKCYTTGDSSYGITGGFPASKLVLGVPFYFRGWTGVPAGGNDGLYQSATGPSPTQTYTQQAGIADWKELVADGLTTSADEHWDPTTQSSWIYDGTNFYTGDTPQAITQRGAYATANGLGGIFAFSFEGDDASGTLINTMNSSMQ